MKLRPLAVLLVAIFFSASFLSCSSTSKAQNELLSIEQQIANLETVDEFTLILERHDFEWTYLETANSLNAIKRYASTTSVVHESIVLEAVTDGDRIKEYSLRLVRTGP